MNLLSLCIISMSQEAPDFFLLLKEMVYLDPLVKMLEKGLQMVVLMDL